MQFWAIIIMAPRFNCHLDPPSPHKKLVKVGPPLSKLSGSGEQANSHSLASHFVTHCLECTLALLSSWKFCDSMSVAVQLPPNMA